MSKDVKKPKSICWFEPSWSFRPRLKLDFVSVLNLWMWARIFVMALILAIILARFVSRRFPDLQFNWTYAFIQAFGGIILYLAAFITFCWVVPPRVQINAKGVCRQQGQHVAWRLRADVQRIILDRTVAERPLLSIESAGKRKFQCGIAPNIKLDSLAVYLRETFLDGTVEERK